jgi:hypothetical protein
MSEWLPCYKDAPRELDIIGHLLVGYGELEFEMCNCVVAVTRDLDLAVKSLFQVRGEKRRIDKADSLTKDQYVANGLGTEHCETMSDMHWCRQIRNQYAHCNWYWTRQEGLCFVDLEGKAKIPAKITSVTDNRATLGLDLLKEQDSFFGYVRRCFWHLDWAYRTETGQQTILDHVRPARVARPPLYK